MIASDKKWPSEIWPISISDNWPSPHRKTKKKERLSNWNSRVWQYWLPKHTPLPNMSTILIWFTTLDFLLLKFIETVRANEHVISMHYVDSLKGIGIATPQFVIFATTTKNNRAYTRQFIHAIIKCTFERPERATIRYAISLSSLDELSSRNPSNRSPKAHLLEFVFQSFSNISTDFEQFVSW